MYRLLISHDFFLVFSVTIGIWNFKILVMYLIFSTIGKPYYFFGKFRSRYNK